MITLYQGSEYSYPCAGTFVPNLIPYQHEDETARPAVVVVPGGGYALVSPSEGEMVAKRFFDAGYQAFVLTYTTNMFRLKPLETQPLRDISRAVRYLRKNAAELHIDPSRVCCCGFSAGAHLVGSLAVHHADVCLSADPNAEIDNRPDAVILCYPVITAGEFAHKDSFTCLFGENPTPEQLAWASLENHVTAQTPPTFLWQTFTDETVPVDNSILFAKSCRAHGVRCELHLFMENKHGLSLANAEWAENEVTPQALQTMMQTWQTMKMMYAQSSNKLPEILRQQHKPPISPHLPPNGRNCSLPITHRTPTNPTHPPANGRTLHLRGWKKLSLQQVSNPWICMQYPKKYAAVYTENQYQ